MKRKILSVAVVLLMACVGDARAVEASEILKELEDANALVAEQQRLITAQQRYIEELKRGLSETGKRRPETGKGEPVVAETKAISQEELDALLAPLPPQWNVSRSVSPLDDQAVHLAELQAKGQPKISLTVRVTKGKADVYVDVGEFLGDEAPVTVRYDQAPAIEEQWRLSTDRESAFSPAGDQMFARLMKSRQLVLRLTPAYGKPVTATFDVSELAKEAPELVKVKR